MSVLGNVINWILGLGAAIFVPIIIIIAGLIVGMKLKDAISAGITLGVAFTGMSMLIGFMSDAIGPAAKAMLTHTGINLPIVDGGWTTLSAIAWSWPYAFLMFPLMIGLNILMLIINKTKTFNADLWNVWGKIFTGVAVAAVSKPYFGTAASIALAFIVAGIQIIFELKMADMYQYRIEKLSGIPGVTCTHKMGFTSIFMFPIDCILKKIPALNKRFDAAALKDKIGIFAESHVLGFILGIIFGILARYSVAATLTLGIQASCALTLFPVISKYFMMALEPISSAISAFMNKKFEKLGFYPADILLPKDQDMTKWAVVACDQFTSEPEYWQAVEQTVGDAPSTLRLILPEANLKAPNVDEYIADINASMDKYLTEGVFQACRTCLQIANG